MSLNLASGGRTTTTTTTTVKRKPIEFFGDILTAIDNDAQAIIQEFSEMDECTWEAFQEVWDKYELVFLYGMGFALLPTVTLIRRAFQTLFRLLEEADNEIQQNGVIFSIYRLHFGQPCREGQIPWPIPITLQSFQCLREIYAHSDNVDILYALYRLFTEDCLQLVELPQEVSDEEKLSELEGDLTEILPERSLKQQVKKIDTALQADPLVTTDYVNIVRVSSEYDSLLDRSLYTCPDLKVVAIRGFPQILDQIRGEYMERNAPTSKKDDPLKRRSSIKLTLTTKGSTGRRATVQLPIRPSTAPPDLVVGDNTDMPDLAFFNVSDSVTFRAGE